MRTASRPIARTSACDAHISIDTARTEGALGDVRELMRAYLAWQLARKGKDRHLIDQYFDAVAYETGLSLLPNEFAEPSGRLLVAYIDGAAVGCVAMRDLGDGYCEMKRLFVHEAAQGCGVGRRLAEALIQEAKGAGYKAMRLDTSEGQASAVSLYGKLGFKRVLPYYEMSAELAQWLLFFELNLQAR
jgi:GNAT superfamily N-acetyltransferase